MELKDPKKIVEEWNASTQKIVDDINKNVKELKESKNMSELVENIQEDFAEIHELTKKMHEDNMNDVCAKMLKKTEDLQEKILKIHDFVENSVNELKEPEAETKEDEAVTEEPVEETKEEIVVESGESSDENNA